jgi:hypothetical protein
MIMQLAPGTLVTCTDRRGAHPGIVLAMWWQSKGPAHLVAWTLCGENGEARTEMSISNFGLVPIRHERSSLRIIMIPHETNREKPQ